MNSTDCVSNKSEEQIRKHWLFSTFCLFILYPITLLVLLLFVSQWILVPEDLVFQALGHVILGLIPMWLIWHCAYRKYGTKLLTLWLVVGPFQQLASIATTLKEMHDPWMIGVAVIDVGIFLWWYLWSLRIRKINKTIQERRALAA